MNLPFTATGELVESSKRLCVEGCDGWEVNLRFPGVQVPVCKPLISIGEHTTMRVVAVMCSDKVFLFHEGLNVAKKIDARIQKEMRDSQYYGCTVAHKENNVYNIYMKPEGNETDAMPLSQSSKRMALGQVRTRNTQRIKRIQRSRDIPGRTEDANRPHDGPMRDGAVDGEEIMIPWVPRPPPERALTGHAVHRSWCRHCVASKGRADALASERTESCQKLASTVASLVVAKKMCCQSDDCQRHLSTGKERQSMRVRT